MKNSVQRILMIAMSIFLSIALPGITAEAEMMKGMKTEVATPLQITGGDSSSSAVGLREATFAVG